MIQLRTQRHIRFAKIEKPTAWVVVAVLVETNGDETVIVSEPKIVRVIPKTVVALTGTVSETGILTLTSPKPDTEYTEAIISPFTSTLFGFSNTKVITGLAPQPPTFK